jgi:hypothetical protein
MPKNAGGVRPGSGRNPHGKEAALVKMEESTVVACGGKKKKEKMKKNCFK